MLPDLPIPFPTLLALLLAIIGLCSVFMQDTGGAA